MIIFMILEGRHIKLEEYQQGSYIFFEDDLDAHFYIIDEGTVQIYTKDNKGHRLELADLGPGEAFGEIALLDKSPRSASAQAITYVKLYKVSEAGYHQLIQELPVWAQSLLKSFANRVRKMNQILKKQNELLDSLKSHEV